MTKNNHTLWIHTTKKRKQEIFSPEDSKDTTVPYKKKMENVYQDDGKGINIRGTSGCLSSKYFWCHPKRCPTSMACPAFA